MALCGNWHSSSPFSRRLLLLLLLVAGISPNPGPQPRLHRPPNPSPLPRILQFNVNGLRTSKSELASYLRENNVKVACLQETKLRPNNSDPSFPGYALLRRDRQGGGGGGVAILISHDVEFTPVDVEDLLNADPHLEAIAVRIHLRHFSLLVYNIYVPPASSCEPNYVPNFLSLLDHADGDAVVVGDFNAHNTSWFSASDDARGDLLLDAVEGSDLSLLNLDFPTRVPRDGNPSSPDVSLATSHLLPSLNWAVPYITDNAFSSSPLNSDHLPILITFVDPFHQHDFANSTRPQRSYVNLRKADWAAFTAELESLVPVDLPSSCAKGERLLRDAVNTAAKHAIPAGYRFDFVPGLPPEAVAVRDERDRVRAANPRDPQVAALERQVRDLCDMAAREEFNKELQGPDGQSNPTKFADLVRRLSGKRVFRPPNQPITFKGKVHTKRKTIAQRFNKQYTSIGSHRHLRLTRRVLRRIRKKKLDPEFAPFADADTINAIRRAKSSSAVGPDGMSMIHLKHFGRRAISYLTNLFNLSVSSSNIPSIWKKAHILPVPKPNKPALISTSYRPISLLCPASKVLERLILPLLSPALAPSPSQHGFRSLHSTSSALLPTVTRIANGFNERKPPLRTATVAIDISKAFDAVQHSLLLNQICDTNLNSNLVHWLAAYLRGRQARTIWQGAFSSWRNVKTGVPQGSVLGPILFNFFVSDCPVDQPSYADDFTFSRSAVEVAELEAGLQADVDAVVAWASSKMLSIAPDKCTITLFTPDKARQSQVHPQVLIGGQSIPLDKRPRILGVNFDTHFNFGAHATKVAKSCREKLRTLRALAGSGWGCQKEVMLSAYKTYVEPVINYAAAVWTPNASDSSINQLQRIQNQALRLATGCHAASTVSHLHQESKFALVKDHLDMLSTQHLASCLRPSHPSNAVVKEPPGPRSMKHTLQSKYQHALSSHLNADGNLDPTTYNDVRKTIHTESVAATISRLDPNRLLGAPPPPISPSESRLTRVQRTTLAQLRSGHCRLLGDYRVLTGISTSAVCPQCLFRRHTVPHIFDCDAAPTNLSIRDLWINPVKVVEYLVTLPTFAPLVQNDPPLPRPPPEPPP